MSRRVQSVPAKESEPLAVAMVLDKSGSMATVRESVIDGYNEYLSELRKDNADTTLSLTTFDTTFDRVYIGEAIDKVANLTADTYQPGGMTALYDAVAHTALDTARRLTTEGREATKVLVVVMTDGLENSSTDYDAGSLATLVESYEARGNWTFVYLGAGHATIEEAQSAAASIGYRRGNAMRWENAPESAKASMSSLAQATKSRRQASDARSDHFFADAGQSEHDYLDARTTGQATAPRPATTLHRRGLDEVLKDCKRPSTENQTDR